MSCLFIFGVFTSPQRHQRCPKTGLPFSWWTPDNTDQGMIWVHLSTMAFRCRAQISFSSVYPSLVRFFPWSHIPLSTQGQPIHWLVKYSPPTHHECLQWAKWWDCWWARQISTSWPTPPSQISVLKQWLHQALLETVSGMAHILSTWTLNAHIFLFHEYISSAL